MDFEVTEGLDVRIFEFVRGQDTLVPALSTPEIGWSGLELPYEPVVLVGASLSKPHQRSGWPSSLAAILDRRRYVQFLICFDLR